MLKYWFKNRLLFGLLTSAALALIFSFAFAFAPSQSVKTISSEESIYLNSSIDFQIPNPSVEQLTEIENQSFVDNTFGYYLTKANLSSDKTSKINLLLTSDLNKMELTMFNEKTLISSVSNDSKFIYLDEVASNSLNAKIGSQVKVSLAGSSFTYTVCRIYATNSLFKEGTAIVDFSGDIKDVYSNNASINSLSGAFIDSNDVGATDSYLNSYKPLGRLKDRSEFDSDEAYNTYNDAILSGNYKNEITNFSNKREFATEKLENAKSKLSIMAIVGACVSFALYILISLILRNRKSENNYFKNVLKNKKSIKGYRIYTFVFDALVYFLITVILSSVFGIANIILIPSVIALVGFVSSLVINMIQDKKYVKQ